MTLLAIPTRRLDRIAMGLSGLCLVHCLATAVLLGLVSAAGSALGAPWIHEVGLTVAMMLGAVALGRGVMEHGFMMPSAVGAVGLGVMAGALDEGKPLRQAYFETLRGTGKAVIFTGATLAVSVTTWLMSSRACRMTVSGPGQKASASFQTLVGACCAQSSICRGSARCTISG